MQIYRSIDRLSLDRTGNTGHQVPQCHLNAVTVRHLPADQVPPYRCRRFKSVLIIISHRHHKLPIRLLNPPLQALPLLPYRPTFLLKCRLPLPSSSTRSSCKDIISQIPLLTTIASSQGSHHITVHGMMQHWQSSPHQHCFGPGGLPIVRIVLPLPLELPEML